MRFFIIFTILAIVILLIILGFRHISYYLDKFSEHFHNFEDLQILFDNFTILAIFNYLDIFIAILTYFLSHFLIFGHFHKFEDFQILFNNFNILAIFNYLDIFIAILTYFHFTFSTIWTNFLNIFTILKIFKYCLIILLC